MNKNHVELFYQKQVMNPYPTESQSHTAYEKGFVEGYNKAKETLYTEEQMIGFAEWILNQDMKLVLIYTKKSLLNEYIQSLKQK